MKFFVKRSFIIWILWLVFIFLLFEMNLFETSDKTSNKKTYKINEISSLLEKEYSLKLTDKIYWYPSQPKNNYRDVISSKKIIFLAYESDTRSYKTDVYWQNLNVYNNRIFDFDTPIKLTPTPNATEVDLTCKNRWCIFGSKVLGRVQSVNLFDLNGETNFPNFKWYQILMQKINFFQQTGELRGIKKIVYFLIRPFLDINFKWNRDKVDIMVDDTKNRKIHFTLSLKNLTIVDDDNFHLLTQNEPPIPKEFIIWCVDSVRAISWVGPELITKIEERVFSIIDFYKRTKYRLFGSEESNENDNTESDEIVSLSDSGDNITWPLSRARSVFKSPEKREGIWAPVKHAFLRTIEDAPPSFYTTYIRSDLERPYSKAYLVSMDLRQLDLEMQAGLVDPVSTTGAQGEGRVPQNEDILSRLVAVFNGAFKTEHGSYGIIINRRIFLPPVNGSATISTFRNGLIGMGTWGIGEKIPPNLISLRQNMEPLLLDGVVNPTKRFFWGFTIGGLDVMQTVRSGICMTPEGQLLYVWGEDLSAQTLGEAMLNGGCNYGMHLDMNPYHTAFIFYNVDPKNVSNFKWQYLTKRMVYQAKRFLKGAPKDFFYLLIKKTKPYLPEITESEWESNNIKQPAPHFLPGIWKMYVEIEEQNAELIAYDLNRLSFDFTLGTKEPDWNFSGWDRSLDKQIAEKTVSFITVGVGNVNIERGIIGDGNVVAPWHKNKPGIIYNNDGNINFVSETPEFENVKFGFQGEWLLKNGKIINNGCPEKLPIYAALGFDKENRYLIYGQSKQYQTIAETFTQLDIEDAMLVCRGGEKNDNLTPQALIFSKNPSEKNPVNLFSRQVEWHNINPQSVLYILDKSIQNWGFRLDTEHGGGGTPKKLNLMKSKSHKNDNNTKQQNS